MYRYTRVDDNIRAKNVKNCVNLTDSVCLLEMGVCYGGSDFARGAVSQFESGDFLTGIAKVGPVSRLGPSEGKWSFSS